MNRKERLEQEVKKQRSVSEELAFLRGVKWADDNPWTAVEDGLPDSDFAKKLSELRNITDKEEYAKALADFFINDKLSLTTLLLMAIDWGEQQPHWISVEDELPENGYEVIVSVGNHFCYTAFRCGDKWYFNDNLNKREISPVTHWMPLPQPPKGGEQ